MMMIYDDDFMVYDFSVYRKCVRPTHKRVRPTLACSAHTWRVALCAGGPEPSSHPIDVVEQSVLTLEFQNAIGDKLL